MIRAFKHTEPVELAASVTGSGPPLILLHGNGESRAIFDQLVPELVASFTVYSLDSRGHGESPAAPLTYQAMADDVARFIRDHRLEHPALFGFSDGGIVGLLLAIQHPGLLSGLVVAGANLTPFGVSARCFMTTTWRFARTRDPLARLMAGGPWISPSSLREISVPTLVLAGERDLIRRSETQRIARHIPDAELRIMPGENHESYITHSPKLAPTLKQFLAA